MGPLGAKWQPKEAKMEGRFDKKTVPKIDAEKVSKNHGKEANLEGVREVNMC